VASSFENDKPISGKPISDPNNNINSSNFIQQLDFRNKIITNNIPIKRDNIQFLNLNSSERNA
jgi:hypothetical protein